MACISQSIDAFLLDCLRRSVSVNGQSMDGGTRQLKQQVSLMGNLIFRDQRRENAVGCSVYSGCLSRSIDFIYRYLEVNINGAIQHMYIYICVPIMYAHAVCRSQTHTNYKIIYVCLSACKLIVHCCLLGLFLALGIFSFNLFTFVPFCR